MWLLDGTLENTFRMHNHNVSALVALPDNQHALSGSWDNTVKLFNVNDGDVLRTFKHHTDSVYCLALLPDSRRFVSGAADNTARIVEHGLALPPTRAYVAAEKEALRARLQDEHRRHADEVERLKTEMAAVEAMQGLAM